MSTLSRNRPVEAAVEDGGATRPAISRRVRISTPANHSSSRPAIESVGASLGTTVGTFDGPDAEVRRGRRYAWAGESWRRVARRVVPSSTTRSTGASRASRSTPGRSTERTREARTAASRASRPLGADASSAAAAARPSMASPEPRALTLRRPSRLAHAARARSAARSIGLAGGEQRERRRRCTTRSGVLNRATPSCCEPGPARVEVERARRDHERADALAEAVVGIADGDRLADVGVRFEHAPRPRRRRCSRRRG